MGSLFQHQENNWVYIFLLVVITVIATAGILLYTKNTIQEINSLAERSAVIERQ